MKNTASARTTITAAIAVGIAIPCFYVVRSVTAARINKAQTVITPFALQREFYCYDNGPSGRLCKKDTVARRSDGTMVHVQTNGPIQWGGVSRILTYPDDEMETVADSIKAKSTMPAPTPAGAAKHQAMMLNPPSNCLSPGMKLIKAQDVVLGHKVVVVQSAPSGPYMVTEWDAPDLGCTPLQYRAEGRQPDGSWKLTVVAKAISLDVTEPNPKLFDEGRSYIEMKPSQIERTLLEKNGVTNFPADLQKGWAMRDRNYTNAWRR